MAYNITSDPYFQDLIKRKPFGYPVIENPYFKSFEFEKVDFFWWHKYASDNWKLPFYAGAVYIVAIFGIQKLMKNRPAFELKYPLFLWNLSIGVLSIIGFIRAFPEFWKEISARNGLYSSICIRNGFDVPTTYWLLAFILSKYLELGDTIFIVLRKRPLIFLQWYHHLVTLIVTWIVAPFLEPIVRWFAVCNSGVHSLMYPYFALRALGVKIPSYISNLITTLQLSQMIIGLGVNMTSWYLQHNGYNCSRHPLSIKLFCFVYGTFILLFGKLFYDSVIKKGRKLKEKRE
ncbi:unnamed protein product [Orchesella dallaii]|uniref:Elongation of very long chain fatty acids protein n=1 Tax=Orchesella dallaii TaxID=48710 RepID=A0ABP1Q9I2_9HEXA